MKIIDQGAEALLYRDKYLDKEALVKERLPKGYRNKAIDDKLRKARTKSECILLHKAKLSGARTPYIYKVDRNGTRIIMEFIEGEKVKDVIGKKNENKNLKLCREIGKQIAKFHLAGIIHGDLTTSNILIEKGELVFVDFGLGYQSSNVEDKGVDLVVFKKTFLATHSQLERGWNTILEGYLNGNKKDGKAVIGRIGEIEQRVRYATEKGS